MKHGLSFISLSCIIFFCVHFSFGQSPDTITFIRFNSYIGYVIDSAENQKCRCITFVEDRLSYGALVQLPDSNLVFRMKLSGRETVYSIPMSKSDIEKIAARTPIIHDELSKEYYESQLLNHLAGDTAPYNLMDYYNLKYNSVHVEKKIELPQDSSFDYTYFNIGMGITSRSGIETYFSLVGDLGFVINRNIISGRVWYNRFINPDYSSVKPKEQITEVGLLYGRLFPIDRISFTANVGVAYSSGVLRGELKSSYATGFLGPKHEIYESISFSEFGIPLKFEMLLGSRRKSKASFAVFADLNARYCFYGFIVSLRPSNEYRPLKPEHYKK